MRGTGKCGYLSPRLFSLTRGVSVSLCFPACPAPPHTHLHTSSHTQGCAELCWLTCVASQRNAEELLRAGGVDALASLLQRFVPTMLLQGGTGGTVSGTVVGGPDAAAASGVVTSALRCVAAIAATGRAARDSLAARPDIAAAVARCCGAALPLLLNSPQQQHGLLLAPGPPSAATAAAGIRSGGVSSSTAVVLSGRDGSGACTAASAASRCLAAVDAALMAVGHMAAHEGLQAMLVDGPASGGNEP